MKGHCICVVFGFVLLAVPAYGDPYCDGLWSARNAVFARNGYCFKSPRAQAVFGEDCFPPYGKLSPADDSIVRTIKKLEREGNCEGEPSAAPRSEVLNTEVPSYTVVVTLSPGAETKLASSGETVRVSAYYFGEAKPGVAADEAGEIQFGEEVKDIVVGQSANLGGQTFSAKEVRKVVGERPQLLINVYSSRRVFQDNILDCGIWQGDAANASTLPISCKLIGE